MRCKNLKYFIIRVRVLKMYLITLQTRICIQSNSLVYLCTTVESSEFKEKFLRYKLCMNCFRSINDKLLNSTQERSTKLAYRNPDQI
jgi:hypothetical protein